MSTTETAFQGFRLSPQQVRIWSLAQADPDVPLHAWCAARLRGSLDRSALEEAIASVVRSHEILRTHVRVIPGAGLPVQVVEEDVRVPLEYADLEGLPAPDREGAEAAWIESAGARLREAVGGSLLRAGLFRRGADDHVLYLVLPAVCADLATLDNLASQLAHAYGRIAGGSHPEPEEVVQYVDFSEWLNEMLTSEEAREGREFWARSSAPDPAEATLLGGWAADPGAASAGPGAHRERLSPALTRRLDGVAAAHGVSAAAWLLAAWQVLIHRHGAEGGATVGVAVEGRSYEEFHRSLGPFAKYVPLPGRVRDGAPFAALAAEVEAALGGARSWQDYYAWEPRSGALSGAAFGFDYGGLPPETETAGGVAWSVERRWHQLDHFGLRLSAERLREEGEEVVQVTLHHDAAHPAAGAARLLRRYGVLLRETLESPATAVAELGLLDPEEREEVLFRWNATGTGPAVEEPVHRLFEAQAARTPDAVAVGCEGAAIPFRELDAAASRMAGALRERGVGRGARVGLLMERSPEMVAALLGVLKAGGAYVPLDPGYPADRLRFVAEDAGLALVVAQPGLESRLDPRSPVPVVSPAELAESEPVGGAPMPEVDGLDAAYVIYTSGSTGTPKGVVVEHRGLANQMAWMQRRFPLAAGDVVLQKTPFNFDASVWEILAPLLSGARLELAPQGSHADGAYLAGAVARHGVTTLQVVPSQLRLVLAAGGLSGWRGLRRLFCGGEPLTAALCAAVSRELPGVELVNLYGPTESTVQVAFWQADEQEPGSVPIGGPVSNTRLFVLDRFLRPVPAGVRGELYVGGVQVARGYLGRPDLTAERFVPDPFSGVAGARLYRTGDLCRWRLDGALESLGRLDDQVKVRGYRVELGEIEAVLERHPAVRAAAVVVRGEEDEARLVGYWVPQEGGPPAAEEALRDSLHGSLPPYMVPSMLVQLDALPLLPSGKLDRKALPEPVAAGGSARAYEPPATPLEEALALIWAEVLGVERLGAHDNFFSLGGDSILSVRVVGMARERGLTLSVQDLFERQTVRALAEKLARDAGGAAAADAVLGRERHPFDLISGDDRGKLPEDAVDAYPLAALQAGMLYHQELARETPAYHNVNSYQFRGHFDEECFRRAVQRSVDLHENLRTSIHLRGFSEPLQVVHAAAAVPVHVEDLRHLEADEQERHLRAFREREFRDLLELTVPPLMRLHVHRRADDRFQLTLTECHAIADGWSTTSLFGDIFRDYAALLRGEPLPERPLPQARFRDFVELEREAVRSEATQRFWRERLAGLAPLRLPQLPERFRESGKAGTERLLVRVSPELQDGLRRLARAWAVPLRSILLTAHLKMMGVLTGRRDVVTGVVSNGRPEVAGGADVRGLFLNTLPMRLELGHGSWRELVRDSFRTELAMLPHRRYPLAQLQREHGPERLFETTFNLVHFHSFAEVMREGVVEVVDNMDLAETSYPFMATASLHPVTSDILSLMLQYRASLFSGAQVREIGEGYRRVLEAMVAAPEERHDAVPLLSDEARREVLRDWNASDARLLGMDVPVQEGFAAQAARTPGAVALESGDRMVTYAELEALSNRLTHHLRGRGVGPESRVGLLLERSPEMVISILAVLKAGGAYVPLDPAAPAERLAFQAADAGLALVLTQRALRERIGPGHRAPLLVLEDAAAELVSEPAGAPGVEVDGRSAAYVVYTSGSTGRPKGVVVEHRSLSNHMAWMQSRYPLDGSDAVLQKTPYIFDASVWEIFAPLLAGARLVLAPPGAHADARYLAGAVARHHVTTLQVVPSQLHLVQAGAGLDSWTGLRRLFSGGEPLTAALCAAVREKLPEVELVNLFGPTEATIQVTHWRVGAGEGDAPIGRPVANARVFVLDEGMNPLPPGVPGELFLGGAALARGYLGRPDLTAERFVPDPFAGVPGARLYRSGDLGWWTPDGVLEFLGRVDEQVKIRGFRIEPGEVEAALLEHGGVAQACVAARRDRGHDHRLVAYVVPAAGERPGTGELLAHLRGRLPEHAVPAAFVTLDALPLTASGKVDRRALPEPDRSRPELEVGYLRPESELEERIAAIWAEVLDLERVGAHDNFFDLGGHSLLLMRVHERLERVLGREVPLVGLLQNPTVRSLAEWLGGRDGGAEAREQGGSRGEARRAAMGLRGQLRGRPAAGSSDPEAA
ncbi:MAG TPA: amino acid adenylation domain-containing protein [Longimicrobiaceae bacterium]|nr:amino acid adenylation domain-containing protein [Longimicrobiaceae bacterium]